MPQSETVPDVSKSPIVERILAFDPGGTTGIAFTPQAGKYVTCVAKTPEEAWSFITPETCDVVLFENFAATTIDRHGLHTVRVVGGIQSLCALHKIRIVRQRPQERRAFIDIARKYLTETLGPRKFVVHEVDALSHILSYEWRRDNK